LRRVQWQTNEQNEASIKTALRMGFRHEGVKRWEGVVPASAGKPNTVKKLPREGALVVQTLGGTPHKLG
jgi:hypothetical protein